MSYQFAAFVFGIAAYALRAIATARLREKHPAEWARLGNPMLTEQGPQDYASQAMAKFLLRGEFFKVSDTALWIYCIAFYLALAAAILLMIFAMVLPEQQGT